MILLDQQEQERLANERPAVPDAIQAAELARLALELPKLIPLMPYIGGSNPALVHRAAVQQMATGLLKRQTQIETLGMVRCCPL
jgi:nuclear pore complex protein Nup98-Nup96